MLQFEAALRRVGASELLRSRGGPTPAAGLASTMGVQVGMILCSFIVASVWDKGFRTP